MKNKPLDANIYVTYINVSNINYTFVRYYAGLCWSSDSVEFA